LSFAGTTKNGTKLVLTIILKGFLFKHIGFIAFSNYVFRNRASTPNIKMITPARWLTQLRMLGVNFSRNKLMTPVLSVSHQVTEPRITPQPPFGQCPPDAEYTDRPHRRGNRESNDQAAQEN